MAWSIGSRFHARARDAIVLSLAACLVAAGSTDSHGQTACSAVMATCGSGPFVIDSCDQPATHPGYNPCMTQQCVQGLCFLGSMVANGTPCNDAYSGAAPLPNGACTSSSLLNLSLWPHYFSCAVTSGQANSIDCPPNHKCLCDGAACPLPCFDCGVCVCNDGCGGPCNDVCMNGVCTRDRFGPVEPTPLQVSSSTVIEWPAAGGASHWNTYRGTIPVGLLGSRPPAGVYDHTCFESADALGDGMTVSTDGAAPPVGTGYYYLVSGEAAGCETALGRNSSGVSIPNTQPCPSPP